MPENKDIAKKDAPRRNNRNHRDHRDRDRVQEPKEFEEVVVNVDRVARVVKGGRRFRFKALVVVGDHKNRIGIGIGKGTDVQLAIAKATKVAEKNVITIALNGETIPHDSEVCFESSRVLLKPASAGTGIIAGGVVRSIIGVTGIKDLLTKSLGSSNKVNIAYATIEALRALVPRSQWLNVKTSKKTVKKEASND